MVLPFPLAVVTIGNPLGKPLFLEMFKAGIIVLELPVEIVDRVP